MERCLACEAVISRATSLADAFLLSTLCHASIEHFDAI
jgi:hypothetical protein